MLHLTLSPDQIDPPLIIAREQMDPARFEELVADVKAHGLEQPIIVTRHAGRFRLVDGYRRWQACQRAGMVEIPCVLKDLDEAGEVETLLRVALHREDFNPVEEGKMFAVMHEGLHLTVDGIAQQVGKSPSYVAARLAIVHGPEDVREALRTGEITLSVARELLRCQRDDDRDYFLGFAKGGGATADTVRRWITERALQRASTPAPPDPGAIVSAAAPYQPIMGSCEWHRGAVPLDGTLSFRVCGQCYQALTALRDDMERQDREREGGPGGPAAA